jgi:hypothetical protein
MTHRYAVAVLATVASLAGAAAAPALAQGDLDTPTVTLGVSGFAKQTITVTAGPSGAPGGFTIWWMTLEDFIANGNQWWLYGDPTQGEATFTGTPTLNVFPGEASSFALGPNESITVEIGDLADESGVAVTGWRSAWGAELEYGRQYVFCGFANATPSVYQSGFTDNFAFATIPHDNCTYTMGFWKNHPEDWSCVPDLGGFTYTQAELLAILNEPVAGNGAISLAHQLIAFELNVCQGADPSAAATCRADAHALLAGCGSKVPPIGTCYLAPAATSATTQCLDDYNNGVIGPGHCPPTQGRRITWGELKVLHR